MVHGVGSKIARAPEMPIRRAVQTPRWCENFTRTEFLGVHDTREMEVVLLCESAAIVNEN